jgi:putative peptidoglycan lipid II flippase
LQFDARLKISVLKVAFCAALMGAYLLGVAHVLSDWFTDESSLKKLIALGVLVGGGGMLYLVAAQVTGVLRVQDIKQYFVKNPKVMPKDLEALEAEGQ